MAYHAELINRFLSWSAERAVEWYKTIITPFGCNFVTSSACNSTQMWQESDFDRELNRKEMRLAAAAGYNCLRIFLPYVVYRKEKQRFLARFDGFLSDADAYGLKCVPVLFDDCGAAPVYGKQEDVRPFIHNGCWTACPGASDADDLETYDKLKEYIQAAVGGFAHDKRVLFWDIFNEAGNSGRGSKSIFLLEKAFEWAREMKPAQPLTAGAWALDYIADADVHKTDLKALELSDIVTFHLYTDGEKLSKVLERYSETGYPVVCTEWMARHFNSLFKDCLPVFKRFGAGCINWGLVNGATQTHFPWGWDSSKGEPEIWFHDVYKKDGIPYNTEEMTMMREYGAQLKKK